MSDVNSPEFWETIYQQGAPWDLGTPAPVFRRLLESGEFEPGRMIVLGAGRGYDARMFARQGFEVTAVDFAAAATDAMRVLAEPDALVEVVQSDLFALPLTWDATFDYVLEYTCFCAIDPARRPAYADLVSRLLKPGGAYIALVFPIWDQPGGPPFAVSPQELMGLLLERGFELQRRQAAPPDSVSPRRQFEELLIFQLGA
ncbi:MAG TPA: methyltransferase domain-containing protein [Anaerolineae bacterium]|jgi:SAM-dependent methyltransferase